MVDLHQLLLTFSSLIPAATGVKYMSLSTVAQGQAFALAFILWWEYSNTKGVSCKANTNT